MSKKLSSYHRNKGIFIFSLCFIFLLTSWNSQAQQSNSSRYRKNTDKREGYRSRPYREQQRNSFRNRRDVRSTFGMNRYKRELEKRLQKNRRSSSINRTNPYQTRVQQMAKIELRQVDKGFEDLKLRNANRRQNLLKNFKSPDSRLTRDPMQLFQSQQQLSGLQRPKRETQTFSKHLDRYKKDIRHDQSQRVDLIKQVINLIKRGQIAPGDVKIPELKDYRRASRQGEKGLQELNKKTGFPLPNQLQKQLGLASKPGLKLPPKPGQAPGVGQQQQNAFAQRIKKELEKRFKNIPGQGQQQVKNPFGQGFKPPVQFQKPPVKKPPLIKKILNPKAGKQFIKRFNQRPPTTGFPFKPPTTGTGGQQTQFPKPPLPTQPPPTGGFPKFPLPPKP
ncbi:hypothetical protein ACFL35_12355 [Candidatus Riflebacteria bacterium]